MKTRIVLLALGFPARNHLERGAQLAMHEYHRLLFSYLIQHSFSATQMYWRKRKVVTDHETFFARHNFDDVYSAQFALLCKKIGISPISVFCRNYYHSSVASMFRERHLTAMIVGVDLYFSYSENERKAIFAHEAAHLLLPFDIISHACDSKPIGRAKELAADAISAYVLGDARPLLFLFDRFLKEGDPDSEKGKGYNFHPSHLERIDQLLNINAGRLHAR